MRSIGTGRAGPLAAIVAVAFAVQTGTAAAANTAKDAGSTLTAAAAAYRSAYPQMSEAAAARAARDQDARKSLYDTLTRDGAAQFGGAWFDLPSGVLHVTATTSDAAARAAARARELDLRVETTVVARSFDALERQADDLRGGTGPLSLAARGQIGIDVRTNRVVVAVPAAQRPALEQAGVPAGVTLIDDPGVSVEPDACTSRALCDTTIRAGSMPNVVPHRISLVAGKIVHPVVDIDGGIEYPAVVSPDERPQVFARFVLVLGL